MAIKQFKCVNDAFEIVNTTITRRSSLLFLIVLLCIGLPIAAAGQAPPSPDPDITNEYRATLVTSKPVSDKAVMFAYLGYVRSKDKHVRTLYYSPPGIIYRPKPWMEIWAGLFGIYNSFDNANNSWEMRPLTGVKFFLPNKKKMNIYNFTRFEYRFINQNHNTTSQPRLRNRVGIEAPLSKNKWAPKTFYMLADVEPMWRLDDKYMSILRIREGLGYVFNKTWRAEFIYHTEFTKANKTAPINYTGNIWRINIKLNLPRRGKHDPQMIPDIDE